MFHLGRNKLGHVARNNNKSKNGQITSLTSAVTQKNDDKSIAMNTSRGLCSSAKKQQLLSFAEIFDYVSLFVIYGLMWRISV